MVRWPRLLMTAFEGEELWLTCLKKENYPVLRVWDTECSSTYQSKEIPHSQTICAINADNITCECEGDLKGGFPLPAFKVADLELCQTLKELLTQKHTEPDIHTTVLL